MRAQDLLPGDEVFTSRGGWARIGSGTWLAREQLVYNFEVEGSHTYFVGETGTWVHNQCWSFAVDAAMSGEGITTWVGTNGTNQVRVMGSLRVEGNRAILTGVHIEGAGPGSLGAGGVRGLASDFGRHLGVNEVVVNGGARTTGPVLGRSPSLTFRVR